MKKFQLFYSILEKVFFVLSALIIIIYASGIKYDLTKQQIIQTGALTINNLEDNSVINFNDNKYENKNDITISYLDPKSYSINITKQNYKNYFTNLNIKAGQIKFLNPILIPNLIKSDIIKDNILAVNYFDGTIFYVYKDQNNIFLDRINTNKTLLGLDSHETRINITKEAQNTDKISMILLNSKDYIIATIGDKELLLDFINLIYKDISSIVSPNSISQVKYVSNTLIYSLDKKIYSLSLKDINNLKPNFIHDNINLLSTVDEDSILLIVKEDSNEFFEKYSLDGNQNEKILLSGISLKHNLSSYITYFNKLLYMYEDTSIYKLVDTKIIEFDTNIETFQQISKDSLLSKKANQVIIYNKNNNYIYSISQNIDIKQIQFLDDLYTFFYVDHANNLHLSDLGGQDNILQKNINEGFIVIPNGTSTNIYLDVDSSLNLIKLGNNK